MKYLVKPTKYILAYIFILLKFVLYIFTVPILVGYDLNFINLKPWYNYLFDNFYVGKTRQMDRVRLFKFNNIEDFVKNRQHIIR